MPSSRHSRPPRGTAAQDILAAWGAKQDAERNVKRQRFITQIQAAFDGVTLGRGVSLHQGRALDCYEPDDVVARAR